MSEKLSINKLRCEYLNDPLGIDETRPRFSYVLESDRRGAKQIARRIRVATSERLLLEGQADLWDSGWCESRVTSQIEYLGARLKSRMVCHWQVEVEDELGERHLSGSACWSMGLLDPSDWQARWIAADPEVIARDDAATAPSLTECGTPVLFRKEFELDDAPMRATLYLTARGLVEAKIGGRRVGEDLFAPEWTDYDTRIHYRTYDVTSLLGGSSSALGLTLGDGWWSGYVGWQETRARYGDLQNSVCAQLEVEYEDGRRQIIVTDSSWQCDTGPILSSDFMMGESYDARRESPGWSSPGFAGEAWLSAIEIEAPAAVLCSQRSEPVRVIDTLSPVSRVEVEPGVWIFDIGQNISGWARIRVNQPAGTRIQIRYAERLKPDGQLYTENLRLAKSTDVYMCRGGGDEVWEPHFTFHGFQYIEITGLVEPEGEDCVVACVIHSATPPAGSFDCSNSDVTRLWKNGLWSQKDNFLSVPTDCPQRDERLGWMGDAQVFLRTATYNMDVAAFFTKWMVDVCDAQTAEGIFPDTAPRLREGENFVGLDDLVGGAAWADAGIIIPHTLWKVYRDKRLLERHWDSMAAWMDYLERTNPDYLRVNDLRNNYGDWLCIPSDREFRTHSPMKNLLATAYWADDAAKMAEMAKALGKVEEAEAYLKTFQRVKAAFQAEFVNDDGSLSVETQTAYLLALAMDLLPQELRAKAAAHLVENIKNLDWHLSTGFVGIRFLNPVLTDAGYGDVAYRLLLQDSYPSWLYPVKHGATTIWERWNGWTEEGGFFDPLMNSFNHYSLGSVGEWLFSHVAGLQLDDSELGFAAAQLKPYVGEGLDWVKASYDSLHGTYESAWEQSKDAWIWRFRIPANARASVWIPVHDETSVDLDGLEIYSRKDGWLLCHAESGSYEIKVSGRVRCGAATVLN
ncbi:family 78 glycoside hydrolase catalytic domain [Pelagicoccus sp. SDUM812005]|uniref:alpha-L-rhamnosidase n=1 Tax=Pelagicoccus sp. SDUM812005 TaxID=3041257 RepID=UPI0028101947|nr:family 78 glycoside hydrolase catalytic domain [Pelagicoccus sp. SDUM812005]MDQ8179363.1 family 78 glycoside hydrolase catalytic domain [Pelagicoccus sp. SDUM812005]